MENKTYPVEILFKYLTRDETAADIAKEVGVDLSVDKSWFVRTYKATVELFTQSGPDLKLKFSSGLRREEMQSLISTFISVITASKKKFDAAKSTPGKKMYAINNQGDAQTLDAFSMNETEDWDSEQKEDFSNKLYEEGVITRVHLAWIEEYPDKGTNQFEPALKMALDILIEQVPKQYNGPLMPSDIKEIEDFLKELVLSFEPAKSIFNSTGKSQKNKSNKEVGYVDPQPFEKGSYSTVGLNESVDAWTEAKLRKLSKKNLKHKQKR